MLSPPLQESTRSYVRLYVGIQEAPQLLRLCLSCVLYRHFVALRSGGTSTPAAPLQGVAMNMGGALVWVDQGVELLRERGVSLAWSEDCCNCYRLLIC